MNNSLFKRPFFWYGVYYGIASILMFTIIYAVNFEFFGRFLWLLLVSVSIMATLMIMGGNAEKKHQGGYRKYSQALLDMFLIGVIGSTINLLFNIAFVNLVDTSFYTNLAEVMKESTMKFMQSFGEIPEEQLEKTMEQMDKQFAEANTPAAYIRTLFFNNTPLVLIIALICAIFVKKNPPENLADTTILDTEN
jgi:ABC-type multidrug transport system fused ATPase/permease subunit